MYRLRHALFAAVAGMLAAVLCVTGATAESISAPSSDWVQWAHDAQHQGMTGAVGQPLETAEADYVYDPFTAQEQADFGGDLSVHYQVPLTRGNDLWLEAKSGTYTPTAPGGSNFATHWNSQIWNERRLTFTRGRLVQQWNFQSDWKPEPPLMAVWEPVFHAALVGDAVFVPGAGGSVFEVDAESGHLRTRFTPFGGTIDPSIYVAGPITGDAAGDVYYNAIQLNADFSTAGSWLVKIDGHGRISKVAYADLVSGAPTSCLTSFGLDELPWPPSPDAVPSSAACGIQRTALNVAPAVAPDGTVYVVSRADRNERYGYLVAVGPDLRPKWAASLRGHLADGCGVLLPIAPDATPRTNSCRVGTHVGVDPSTNQAPAGSVLDLATSSPVVMPDGGVLLGTFSDYDGARGHLLEFGPHGDYRASYDFGWDITPAVFVGADHREHVVIKENHYPVAYCPLIVGLPTAEVVCALPPPGPYYVTQLDANLVPEWQFKSTNTQSCQRLPDGSLQCVSDHPEGFEWCVNAPAVDRNGAVYLNSEDGNLYAIDQGHHGVFTKPEQSLFLNLAVGAAYTPLSSMADGHILTQNDGHLFVVGKR